jgi:hypothetical protein
MLIGLGGGDQLHFRYIQDFPAHLSAPAAGFIHNKTERFAYARRIPKRDLEMASPFFLVFYVSVRTA